MRLELRAGRVQEGLLFKSVPAGYTLQEGARRAVHAGAMASGIAREAGSPRSVSRTMREMFSARVGIQHSRQGLPSGPG